MLMSSSAAGREGISQHIAQHEERKRGDQNTRLKLDFSETSFPARLMGLSYQ